MESNTALSQFVYVALHFWVRWFCLFDSLVIGDVTVHKKFTGIHIMDLHPLAGLASIALQLETSFKSSAAEGRKEGKKGGKKEGREKRRKKGGRERKRKEGKCSYN